MKRKILASVLRFLANNILRKFHPRIIGITGTVGKTSAKEAIFHILRTNGFRVSKSFGNLNNQFGVPLSIIGITEQPQGLFGWLQVLVAFWKTWRAERYPDWLVLEMAIDRPGDMDFFTGWIKPQILVLTSLGKTHAEFFKSVRELWEEKLKLITAVQTGGVVIVNADLVDVQLIRRRTDLNYITLGSSSAVDENWDAFDFPAGIPKPWQEALTIAWVVGKQLGLNEQAISSALESWQAPAHRLEIVRHDLITVIDDSYNASPQSMKAGLKYLTSLSGDRKIAILGDMRELGADAESEHLNLGHLLQGVDILISVGRLAGLIGQEGVRQGKIKESDFYQISDWQSATEVLDKVLQVGDVVLVKGSFAMGLTNLVEWLKEKQL